MGNKRTAKILADSYDFLTECKLNTTQYLQHHAQTNPKRVAIAGSEFTLNYASLVDVVEAMARRLQAAGVNSTSTVELTLANVPVALVVSLALQRLGCACFIPFTPGQSGIVPCDFYIDRQTVEGRKGKELIVTSDWVTNSAVSNDGVKLPDGFASIHSVAVITASTGTTGVPKIIASPLEKLHNSIVSGLRHPGQAAGKAPCLVVASLGSLWSYRQMLTILWSGGTLVLGQAEPATAIALKTLRVRHLATPVGRLADWLKIARNNRRLFDGLEAVTTAGAMLTPALEREVQTYICRQVYTNYGTTETGLIASSNSFQRSKYPNCVGSIVPGVRVEIVDEAGQVLPEGEVGRVRVWVGQSHDTHGGTLVRDGWFYPSDLGVIRDGDLLCIEGRVDDVINVGGRKFSLDVLDDQLVGCKGISDHAIFAVPDNLGIIRLYCAVCPTTGFNPEVVRSSMQDAPPFAKIFELEKLPRSVDGKIKRRELVELVTGPKA